VQLVPVMFPMVSKTAGSPPTSAPRFASIALLHPAPALCSASTLRQHEHRVLRGQKAAAQDGGHHAREEGDVKPSSSDGVLNGAKGTWNDLALFLFPNSKHEAKLFQSKKLEQTRS
jgi:hypothetical protein